MDIRKILKDILGLDALPKGDGLVGYTDEQLDEAKKALRDIATYNKELRDREALKATVEAFESISAEQEKRAADDAELNDLSSRITVESDDEPVPEPEPAPDPEPETPEATEPPAATESEPQTIQVAEPEPVVAAPPVIPEPSETPASDAPPVTLIAAGDVKGLSAGQNMRPELVADAMASKADAMWRSRSSGRFSVGEMHWRDGYPQDRFLDDQDSSATNTRKINEAVTAAQTRTYDLLRQIEMAESPAQLNALVAEGGLCAPVNVRYEIFTVGTTARPLRDSLTRFGATRGGIRFNAPPTLASVRFPGSDAVNIYTEAQDTEGTVYPKGCIRVDCGADTEVAVQAITLCMEVGQWQRMFFPENFTAWWGLGRVEHARVAEDAIWDRLDALSTNVTAGEGLGATPDTLAQVERAASQYRDRHRIDPETPLRLRAPSFLRDIMRVDLARRPAGDDTLGVSNATIARYFAVRNIAVTWVLDGQIAGGTSGYTQGANALNPWPSTVDVNLSIDGTFLFLDGGTLDFGTEIRDWDQIRNNDVGAFMETFENTAFVGPEAIHLTLNICPDGTTSFTDDNFAPCTTGS